MLRSLKEGVDRQSRMRLNFCQSDFSSTEMCDRGMTTLNIFHKFAQDILILVS